MTICLFNGGILNGLQFEQEECPYRIRVEYLEHLPLTVKVYADGDNLLETPYKRGSEIYIATNVDIKTETHLDGELQGRVVVYKLERSW